MSNLQTNYHFQLDLKEMEQHTGGKWLINSIKRYPSFNMSRAETSRELCIFAEPELPSYRGPKRVAQKQKYGQNIPNNNHINHEETCDEI